VIVDSSALLAILMKEPERDRLGHAMGLARQRRISAATLVEAAIAIETKTGAEGAADLDRLLADLNIQVVPFTAEQAALAREAFRRFGKGRHPARLNFGDCFAYALAKDKSEPLLFKGGDFPHTDIEPAAY
jgi:ribonuclease VapC